MAAGLDILAIEAANVSDLEDFATKYLRWLTAKNMASYTGIHIESTNQEGIASAIEAFEGEKKKRKVRRPSSNSLTYDKIIKPGVFCRAYFVCPSIKGWTEIITSCNAWSLRWIAQSISGKLNCRCAVFGYVMSAGTYFYHLSEYGNPRRTLWFTRGESIHEEFGEPMECETMYFEKQRELLTLEDLDVFEKTMEGCEKDEDSETMLFPDCDTFAEGINCHSYPERLLPQDFDSLHGIGIRSTPKWWIIHE